MNKLKKILILLPILATTLFIKEVKADSYDIYQNNKNNSCTWLPNGNTYYTNIFQFSAFDDTFNYYVNDSLSLTYINSILYYLKDSSQYMLLVFYSLNSNVSSTNHDIDFITCSANSENYCLSYYDSSDTKVEINTIPSASYKFLTKTYSQSWYSSNIPQFSYAGTRNQNNSPYDIVYQSGLNYNSFVPYIINNQSNLELIKVDRGSFYIRGVLQKTSSSEPEPEPEIQNFNKLYVPDYNDNMCVEVIDKDTIRVFEDNETLDYTDYYVNSHYLSKTGSVDSEYIKNCTSLEKSSSFIYRNDIPEILFVSLLACVFTYLSMYLLFRVFRKRSR